MTQGIQKQVSVLPAIEAECHFVQVGREMFGTNLVPRSNNSALQQREKADSTVLVWMSPSA
jgi:hypothetical protein